MEDYFEELDLTALNDFQRRALAGVSEVLRGAGIELGRTHAQPRRGKPTMVWLTVDHRDRAEYNLEIVLEQDSIVVNLGPAHEHFGYGEPDPAVDDAIPFIDAVLHGKVEMDLILRGRSVVKTVLFRVDNAGDRHRMSTEANILALLLAPFLRRRIVTERISFV